jgi:hypothetical protein
MPKDDKPNNVVKLRQPPAKVAGVSIGASGDEAIMPKSLLNMTEVEQQAFLNHLRERRLRAAAIMKEAHANKHRADSISAMVKLEKKALAAAKEYERASKALDKLENLLGDLRILHLQHTDVDITRITDDDKH